MKSFLWGQHVLTGLSDVDNQHHRLVDIINQFGSLLSENVVHIENIDCLYNQLADYAVYHFQEEETLMAEFNVDTRHLNHHTNAHKHFLDEVSFIYSEISSDKPDKANTFLKFLIHWLAYHILGEDQDMARQIKAIKSGMTPDDAYNKLEQERASATAPLVEALNGLFKHVSIQNNTLRQLNESLEEKVALRTKELSEANQSLQILSCTDTLTQLHNRRYAMEHLSNLWKEAQEKDSNLTCMMIDADHFKEVNDLYGHDAGDIVLTELAKTIKYSLRNDDIACRLGGDEFFVICPHTDKKGGMHIAELVRKTVAELRVPTGGKPWHGSISIGVASRSPEMASYEELTKAADNGLYAAKEAGKNCVRTTD